MKSIFANKKLLLVLIVVLIGASIGGAILYRTQKAPTPPGALAPPEISPEAVQAKCLEDVSQMTVSQIQEKISGLAFASGEELNKLKAIFANYLVCHTATHPTTEAQYNERKSVLEEMGVLEETRIKYLGALQQAYEYSPGGKLKSNLNQAAPYKIITYAQSSICPQGKMIPSILDEYIAAGPLKRGMTESKAKEIVGDYCSQIEKYSNDKASLASEVYDFKNWRQDLQERITQRAWKAMLAFRFGGETMARQVCSNLLNNDEKNSCGSWVDKLASLFLVTLKGSIDCHNADLNNAVNLICKTRQ